MLSTGFDVSQIREILIISRYLQFLPFRVGYHFDNAFLIRINHENSKIHLEAMGQLSSILKMCELKTIVYKMLCLTTLCWSSFAKTSRANALHISGLGMSPEESHSISIKAPLTLNHDHKGFQESNTVLQQPTDILVHAREKTTGRYSKKGRYRKGRSRITQGFKQRKRDYFFTPASSYDEMPGSVDRRMFLVHQEERGEEISE